MEFKHWFCLKDRDSFTIDPKINSEDARFYFGRAQLDQRMQNQLKRAFIDPQVPKMMVWGPYGCGKTQTLYYLAYWLEHNKPPSCKGDPHTVHLEIEVRSKSTAVEWHLQNMEALGMAAVQGWLKKLFSDSEDFDVELAKLTSDPNIVQAFSHMRGGGAARRRREFASPGTGWLISSVCSRRRCSIWDQVRRHSQFSLPAPILTGWLSPRGSIPVRSTAATLCFESYCLTALKRFRVTSKTKPR